MDLQQQVVSRDRAAALLRRHRADKDNPRRARKAVDKVDKADRAAEVRAVDPVGAASISTTCSSDCQLFLWPMLRSATLSSFPVRRELIQLV